MPSAPLPWEQRSARVREQLSSSVLLPSLDRLALPLRGQAPDASSPALQPTSLFSRAHHGEHSMSGRVFTALRLPGARCSPGSPHSKKISGCFGAPNHLAVIRRPGKDRLTAASRFGPWLRSRTPPLSGGRLDRTGLLMPLATWVHGFPFTFGVSRASPRQASTCGSSARSGTFARLWAASLHRCRRRAARKSRMAVRSLPHVSGSRR